MSVTFGWMEINEQAEKWIKHQEKAGKKPSHKEVIKYLDRIERGLLLLRGRIGKAENDAKINYIREIKKRITAAQESKKGMKSG